jgi:hypothetical protein
MVIEKVEVHKWANPTTYLGVEQGRIMGGRVLFKTADPMHPVIFINQHGYSTQNLKTKKRMLYYDTTMKRLVKPSSIASGSGSSDAMTTAVQQVLAAEGDSAKAMGINEQNNKWGILGAAIFVLSMIFAMLTLYLVAGAAQPAHSTAPAQSTSGLLGAGVINSTTHISIGGTQVKSN